MVVVYVDVDALPGRCSARGVPVSLLLLTQREFENVDFALLSLQEVMNSVLTLHSGIISRDSCVFNTHFFSYLSVIPGVTVNAVLEH